MLKVRHLKCHAKYWLILDFMRATHSKKVGTGSNKRPEKLNVHIRNSWRTNLQLISSVQKPASLMVWGCMSACGMGSLHIWKGTINAEMYIQVLEQHMLPSRRRLFQGRPCIFQHDNARPHTASITTSWLRRRRIRVLKWPACSPDLSPIENIWRIIKRKMRQRRPKTVEQLEACIRQECDNIPIPNLEQLVSSVSRRLQTVIKRRGDATQW